MDKKDGLFNFIFRKQRAILFLTISILICQFTILKALYPHAILEEDSHHYIQAAMNSADISAWPIGYSKLLGWIHLFSRGDWAVVVFQYILLEGAILYFYFSIKYLLNPSKWICLVILFFLLMNPFIICISNYVLTDSIFAALTIIWFTFTLWYFHKPMIIHSYILVILIFVMFSIRYYAVFYPMITVPIILSSKDRWWVKLSSMVIGYLLFLLFVLYTESLYEKMIGRRDFSPFSGWQLAANALIMYRHIPNREADAPPPADLQSLHQLVLHDLNTMPPPNILQDKRLRFYFTWGLHTPLLEFGHVYFPNDPTHEDLKKWASMGKIYRDYGAYLIKRHPIAFVRYYVGQGIDWFIDPTVEFTNVYSNGGEEIYDVDKNWFGYKSYWLSCTRSKFYSIAFFPLIVDILNFLLLLGITGFFYCRCYKTSTPIFTRAIILVAAYSLANFIFIIFTAPSMLRYALSGMILNIVFLPVLFERIYLSGSKQNTIMSPQTSQFAKI